MERGERTLCDGHGDERLALSLDLLPERVEDAPAPVLVDAVGLVGRCGADICGEYLREIHLHMGEIGAQRGEAGYAPCRRKCAYASVVLR